MNPDVTDKHNRFAFYFPGFAVIALTILVSFSVSREPGFSPDSIHYLDIARTLVQEHRIATYHLNMNSTQIPDPAVLWPPVYPLLLALPQAVGWDMFQSVRAVNILSIIILVLAGNAIFHLLAPRAPPKLFALVLLYAVPHTEVFKYAWTEPSFIALAMLFLLFCLKHICDGRLVWLVLAGVIAALAFLTRYIGIALLPVGMVVVIQRLQIENRTLRLIGLIRLLAFASVFALLIAPWIIRNMLIVGGPLGPARPASTTDILENIRLVINTLRADIPLTLAWLLIGFLALVARCRRQQAHLANSVAFHIVIAVVVFVAGYSVVQVIVSSLCRIDQIGTKFLSPLYPPLMLLSVYTIYRLLSREISNAQTVYRICTAVLCAAIVVSALPLSTTGWRYLVLGRPRSSMPLKVDEWIMQQTDKRALIVGNGAWQRRFQTGRIVLQSGYPEEPDLTENGILLFIDTFGSHISAAYLVCSEGDSLDQMMDKYPIVFRGADRVVVRIVGRETSNCQTRIVHEH